MTNYCNTLPTRSLKQFWQSLTGDSDFSVTKTKTDIFDPLVLTQSYLPFHTEDELIKTTDEEVNVQDPEMDVNVLVPQKIDIEHMRQQIMRPTLQIEVRNIHPSITRAEIKQYFSQFGYCPTTVIPKLYKDNNDQHMGVAYIRYPNAHSFLSALNADVSSLCRKGWKVVLYTTEDIKKVIKTTTTELKNMRL